MFSFNAGMVALFLLSTLNCACAGTVKLAKAQVSVYSMGGECAAVDHILPLIVTIDIPEGSSLIGKNLELAQNEPGLGGRMKLIRLPIRARYSRGEGPLTLYVAAEVQIDNSIEAAGAGAMVISGDIKLHEGVNYFSTYVRTTIVRAGKAKIQGQLIDDYDDLLAASKVDTIKIINP